MQIQDLLEKHENSKLREQIVEYRILTDLLLYAASIGKKLEISRTEHDSFGYDAILKIENTVRYVQFKSRRKSGRNRIWDVHKSLLRDQNGTVILALIEYKEKDILLEYLVLDDTKRSKILDSSPKRKRLNEYKCKVQKGDFIQMNDVADLLKALFA